MISEHEYQIVVDSYGNVRGELYIIDDSLMLYDRDTYEIYSYDIDDKEALIKQFIGDKKTDMKKFENHVKILAMHHHLVGIPDTGSDRLTVIDAGDVLRTILDTHVDLVLCGHKHRPWIWNFGNLSIVNAGTATSERVRGLFENTYNIITVDGKNVTVDLKIVGGKRIPIKDIVKNYSRFGEE